jgi:hypothetical protein
MAARGVRVLVAFDPCILSGGGAILNLPAEVDALERDYCAIPGQAAYDPAVCNKYK